MNDITINLPGLIERRIAVAAESTVALVKWDDPMSYNAWMALLVDGRYYNLIMWKHTIGRPERAEALAQALEQVQAAITCCACRSHTGDNEHE